MSCNAMYKFASAKSAHVLCWLHCIYDSKGTPDLRHSTHFCIRCFSSSSGTRSSTVMGSREKGLISLSRSDRSIVTRSMTVPPVRYIRASMHVNMLVPMHSTLPVCYVVRCAYMVTSQGLPSEYPSMDPGNQRG